MCSTKPFGEIVKNAACQKKRYQRRVLPKTKSRMAVSLGDKANDH